MLRNAPDKKKRRKQKQMRNEGLHRRKENNTPEGAGDDPKRESDNEDPLRLALQGERMERGRLKKAAGGTERTEGEGDLEEGGTMSPLGRTGTYGCVTRTRYKREKGGRRLSELKILQGR